MRTLILFLALMVLSSCKGGYSFTGGNIGDAKSLYVGFFENNAQIVLQGNGPQKTHQHGTERGTPNKMGRPQTTKKGTPKDRKCVRIGIQKKDHQIRIPNGIQNR